MEVEFILGRMTAVVQVHGDVTIRTRWRVRNGIPTECACVERTIRGGKRARARDAGGVGGRSFRLFTRCQTRWASVRSVRRRRDIKGYLYALSRTRTWFHLSRVVRFFSPENPHFDRSRSLDGRPGRRSGGVFLQGIQKTERKLEIDETVRYMGTSTYIMAARLACRTSRRVWEANRNTVCVRSSRELIDGRFARKMK